ncbi:amino acid transporter [Auricularia subglabra TFB-10046 SS5]|uniref:Amino acid transporter n=1 Tax=Auricularia subglabra (strain TFB-10046 / SS5) TaxID=717982 RepID=J0D186_AURST|nr:amino acid transporter [Auricularia subglabra TFB-10046 SS5]
MAVQKVQDDGDSASTSYGTVTPPEPGQVHGVPVEVRNPLGNKITLTSAVMLNASQMIGIGVFSVAGPILKSTGSIGLLLLYWLLGPVIALISLAVYNEYASMFPLRSGGEVVYLEQAYPRPRFLVSTAFAVNALLLSSSATNCIVFAQYVIYALEVEWTARLQNTIAVSLAVAAVAVVGASTKWALRAVNVITVVKILALAFIVATGIAVFAGKTAVHDPYANFHHVFSGSTRNPSSLATALVKINYSFVGWGTAYNVLSEVKGGARTVRKAGHIAVGLVSTLFFFVNVAFVAAVPKEEIENAGQLVAALFFGKVFGGRAASKILPAMIACSCAGNLIAVMLAQARVLREVARQGLLPFPEFFASTKPFGTPLAPVTLKLLITIFIILAPPAEDAVNLLLDLSFYPGLVFNAALAAGVWVIRARRTKEGLPLSTTPASDALVALFLAKSVFMLVMPWIPPEKGRSDVSIWYATYCVVGLGILALCGVYYYFWIILLPKWGGYEIIEEVVEMDDGAKVRRLVRKYRGAGHSVTTISRGDQEPLLR